MSFFITSAGPGNGANLGGLEGADQHCAKLAQAVGAGGKTWRAYLSTNGPGGVNAKDRIGSGPWHNSKGVAVAQSVDGSVRSVMPACALPLRAWSCAQPAVDRTRSAGTTTPRR